MQDTKFLYQFENCTLAKNDFNHKNHLRVAWLYLSRDPLELAISNTTQGILRYATSLGAVGIYHETLTRFWILAVYHAMDIKDEGFEDFIEKNSILLDKDLLKKYYSAELLASDLSRKQWVEPDLRPIVDKAI